MKYTRVTRLNKRRHKIGPKHDWSINDKDKTLSHDDTKFDPCERTTDQVNKNDIYISLFND